MKKDQVIARLEDREYRAQFEQAKAAYDAAQAHLSELERGSRPEEVERAVYFAKYPPRGFRGIGAERSTFWGKALSEARTGNEHTLVIPLIENMEAGRNIHSIMDVPDVDAFFFGPADYSASAGYAGEWEGPGVADEILRVKDQIRARGFACGIMATDSKNGQTRLEQGFQMVGIGADAGLLIRAMTEMMQSLGRIVDPGTWNR